jgi:ADP-heptose:LPS heptosyltransferase
VRWLLFGNAPTAAFEQSNLDDLRGRTTLLDLLAVIRTRCRLLVAPDSGILTAAFYLAEDFPLDVVSLWSDPRQGVLKQGCPSPNPRLRHEALQGRNEDVRNLPVDDVERAIADALDRWSRLPDHADAHATAP